MDYGWEKKGNQSEEGEIIPSNQSEENIRAKKGILSKTRENLDRIERIQTEEKRNQGKKSFQIPEMLCSS